MFKSDNKCSFIKIFNFVLINVFRAILLFMLIDSIISGNKDRILLVALTSLTSFYREYIRILTKVKISDGMQVITTTFIILSALIGTLMGVYNTVIWWDTLLHTVSGIILTFFGLMMLAVMRDKNKNLRFSIGLIILFAFLFSMTAGVIWELMEFSADTFLGMDAQRSQPPATNRCIRYNDRYCC